jgi:hypothetical protein
MFASGGDLAILTGHGNPDEITGQGESTLWKIGSYDPRQVQNKIVKLVSCDCGQQLCADLVQNGALAALGFDDDLLWSADPSYYSHFWDDPYSQGIMIPIIQGINVLLDGGTAQESLDVEKAGYLQNMENAGSELMFSLLKWDYDHTMLIGNPNATISPRPNIHIPFPPPFMFF